MSLNTTETTIRNITNKDGLTRINTDNGEFVTVHKALTNLVTPGSYVNINYYKDTTTKPTIVSIKETVNKRDYEYTNGDMSKIKATVVKMYVEETGTGSDRQKFYKVEDSNGTIWHTNQIQIWMEYSIGDSIWIWKEVMLSTRNGFKNKLWENKKTRKW